MQDAKVTPEERQRKIEVNKIRDYKQALLTLEGKVKALTEERDTLKEALRLACEGVDACNGYCPVNADVKEFTGKCCDCTAAGVYRDWVEKNLKPKGWQDSIAITKQCWSDHFIDQAKNSRGSAKDTKA